MNPSKQVFIDADALVALNNSFHTLHSVAIDIGNKIKAENHALYTCTYTLLEVATVLNMHFKKDYGTEVVSEILEDTSIRVMSGDRYFYDGLDLLKQQTSKNVSFNDCVYFAVAKDLNIDYVFSFDKHWQKNGFKLLN